MSTYLELVQAVRQDLGVSGSGPVSVVNQAGIYKKICDFVAGAEYQVSALWQDWSFLWSQWTQPTTIGVTEYAPPGNIGKFDRESFFLDADTDNFRHLIYVPYKDWRKIYYPGLPISGKPDLFTIKPDNLVVLEPTPNVIVTLTADYWRRPVRMVENADTPSIPEQHEQSFLELAKYKFAHSFKDEMLERQSLTVYQQLLKKLEAAELPNREDGFAQCAEQRITVQ